MTNEASMNTNTISNEAGAVDLDECPRSGKGFMRCRCGKCAVCGYHKHTAIHGPFLGRPAGLKPYGHEFAALGIDTTTGETE